MLSEKEIAKQFDEQLDETWRHSITILEKICNLVLDQTQTSKFEPLAVYLASQMIMKESKSRIMKDFKHDNKGKDKALIITLLSLIDNIADSNYKRLFD